MLNASEELERVEEERLNLLKSTNSIEREIHNIELDVKLKVYFSKEYKNENQRKIMCEKLLRDNAKYQELDSQFEELKYKLECVTSKSMGLKMKIKIYNSIMNSIKN